MVQKAHAKVIYTRAHHVIGENSSFGIDLNHEGVTDFTIRNYGIANSTRTVNLLTAKPATRYCFCLIPPAPVKPNTLLKVPRLVTDDTRQLCWGREEAK